MSYVIKAKNTIQLFFCLKTIKKILKKKKNMPNTKQEVLFYLLDAVHVLQNFKLGYVLKKLFLFKYKYINSENICSGAEFYFQMQEKTEFPVRVTIQTFDSFDT